MNVVDTSGLVQRAVLASTGLASGINPTPGRSMMALLRRRLDMDGGMLPVFMSEG